MFRFVAREQLDMSTMGQSLASAAGHSSGNCQSQLLCKIIVVFNSILYLDGVCRITPLPSISADAGVTVRSTARPGATVNTAGRETISS